VADEGVATSPGVVADRGVVIDASVAINAALVQDAFANWEHVQLVAPTLLWSETASGLSQLSWRGEISPDQARAALDRILAVDIEFVNSADLAAEAMTLARRFGWAKTYDAEYVVLAQRRQCPFVTVDARLASAVREAVHVLAPSDVEKDSFKTFLGSMPDAEADSDFVVSRAAHREGVGTQGSLGHRAC
jgi:predicted nucleic acid-binding protein